MTRQGIPLKFDRNALIENDRRSFVRACRAIEVATRDRRNPDDPEAVVRSLYKDDHGAQLVTRSAVSPTSRGDYPALQITRVLPMLSPAAASTRLLSAVTSIDLSGLTTISVPVLSALPVPIFIAEGAPIPVADLSFGSVVLGPAHGIKLLTALSNELMSATGNAAETILSNALAASTEASMDAALFSSSASSSSQPAGILHAVVPIASTATGGGAQAIASDLGALAKAVSANGFGVDDLAVITTPALAMAARVLVGPRFTNLILSSPAIPDGQVIGLLPQGLVTGFAGNVQVDTTVQGSLHFDDSAPRELVDVGGGRAVPVKSLFQTNTRALRCRGQATWAMHPGAIAVLTGCSWT
jgi:hypothetical protein